MNKNMHYKLSIAHSTAFHIQSSCAPKKQAQSIVDKMVHDVVYSNVIPIIYAAAS